MLPPRLADSSLWLQSAPGGLLPHAAGASVDWFRTDVFKVSTLWAPPAAEHIAWLCRVRGELAGL